MWIGQTAYLEIADGAVPDYQGADDPHRGRTRLHRRRRDPHVRTARRRPCRPADGAEPLDLDAIVAALAIGHSPGWPTGSAMPSTGIARSRRRSPSPTLALAIADGTRDGRARPDPRQPQEPRRAWSRAGSSRSWAAAACPRPRPAAAGWSWPGGSSTPRANPLTPRVLVNRLWKHHFGEGIVKSTDDFGAMGREPTHPELLDWLASRVRRSRLVDQGHPSPDRHVEHLPDVERPRPATPSGSTPRTPSASHERPAAGGRGDPRRPAEPLGPDSPTMYGPGVPVHLTAFMDGRGRPGRSGPLDGDGRRSIYLERPAQLPQPDVPGLRHARAVLRAWAAATSRTSPPRPSSC